MSLLSGSFEDRQGVHIGHQCGTLDFWLRFFDAKESTHSLVAFLWPRHLHWQGKQPSWLSIPRHPPGPRFLIWLLLLNTSYKNHSGDLICRADAEWRKRRHCIWGKGEIQKQLLIWAMTASTTTEGQNKTLHFSPLHTSDLTLQWKSSVDHALKNFLDDPRIEG